MKSASRMICSALAASLLASATAFSQTTTATTVPVGFMSYNLTTGVTSSFGVPLLKDPVYVGTATSVGANTLGVTGANWTPNQFITGSTQYFVTIRSGTQMGRTLLVTANDANTLTLDSDDAALNGAGFAVTAGVDSFELFPGESLESLFGKTADANGILTSGIKGGTSTFTADAIQVYNGTRFVSYFFNTTLGYWVMVNGGTTNQSGLVLYPDDGLLITRRGPDTKLSILGRVPVTSLMTKFPSGTTNAVSVRFPADTTLGGLNFTGPGTWITGANPFVADTVSLWNGTKWVAYFKNASNQWIQVNGNNTDQSAVVIPAGSAIQVLKRGSASGSATFFSQALPYTP